MPYDDILGDEKFASGKVTYLGLQNNDPRMLVPVRFAHAPTSYAIVDTGAPWCVLRPDTFALIREACDPIQRQTLTIRGIKYRGALSRLTVYLDAEDGAGIEVEGTAFVPELQPYQDYPFPDFIGLAGFLERVRYAVDPDGSQFYFANI